MYQSNYRYIYQSHLPTYCYNFKMHLKNYLNTILTDSIINGTFNLAIEIVIISLLRIEKKHYLSTSNSYLKPYFKNLKYKIIDKNTLYSYKYIYKRRETLLFFCWFIMTFNMYLPKIKPTRRIYTYIYTIICLSTDYKCT